MTSSKALACVVAALLCAASAAPALAQTAPTDRLALAIADDDGGYRATKDQTYAAVRDRAIKARLLERLRDFLAPVRLPRAVGLLAAECDGGAAATPFYRNDDRTINVCYQFLAFAENVADKVVLMAKQDPSLFPFPVTRDEFLWGLIGGVLLHESGHALFDVLDVPLFGREEDAADQIGIYVALQLKPKLAEAVVKAYAYFWRMVPDPDSATTKDGGLNADFADEHGTASQRLYNGLCIAYGRSPAEFEKFRAQGWLPEQRAPGCAREYKQMESAFAKTVLPFVDTQRMAEVQGIDWMAADLFPAEVTTTAPPDVPRSPPAAKSTSRVPDAQGPAGRGTGK
jgi:hypothetical protein